MNPYIGEIRMFAGNFAPRGWAVCNGQLMSIAQNTALFSILGTTYGGDGRTTFALPNLQGAAPLAAGQGPGLSDRSLGESGGEASITLLGPGLPSHTHAAQCDGSAGNQVGPGNNVWALACAARGEHMYASSAGTSPAMHAQAIAPAGGNQPHNNMSPYLVVTFIIALEGVYPPRS